jgi:hypothetical protein
LADSGSANPLAPASLRNFFTHHPCLGMLPSSPTFAFRGRNRETGRGRGFGKTQATPFAARLSTAAKLGSPACRTRPGVRRPLPSAPGNRPFALCQRPQKSQPPIARLAGLTVTLSAGGRVFITPATFEKATLRSQAGRDSPVMPFKRELNQECKDRFLTRCFNCEAAVESMPHAFHLIFPDVNESGKRRNSCTADDQGVIAGSYRGIQREVDGLVSFTHRDLAPVERPGVKDIAVPVHHANDGIVGVHLVVVAVGGARRLPIELKS